MIGKKEAGLALDRSLPTALKLIKMITFREGFGDILANGIDQAAREIGRGAEKYVGSVIKGQFAMYEPRLMGFGPMQFAQLTHPGRPLGIGGALGAPSYSPGWTLEQFVKQAERCGVPAGAVSRLFSANSFNVGRLTRHSEDFLCLFNLLGLCHRLYISRFYSMATLAGLYSAVTGIETDPGALKKITGRVWDLWRINNRRAGLSRSDDEPPDVWFQSLRAGERDISLMDYFKSRRLERDDVNQALDEYYDERGWDRETGMPPIR